MAGLFAAGIIVGAKPPLYFRVPSSGAEGDTLLQVAGIAPAMPEK